MKRSYYVTSEVSVDDRGSFVNVDLEKTSERLNQLLGYIEEEGGVIDSVTPVLSGVGQFQYGELPDKESRWGKKIKPTSGGFGYGLGYSYTSGFLVLASISENGSK